MPDDISEDEAIRRIVDEGGLADYVDVANAVQKRFGLRVGSAKVEEAVIAMRKEAILRSGLEVTQPHDSSVQNQQIEESDKSQPQSGRTSATPGATLRKSETLQFVETMGGFDAARAAIDELEQTVKNLSKQQMQSP